MVDESTHDNDDRTGGAGRSGGRGDVGRGGGRGSGGGHAHRADRPEADRLADATIVRAAEQIVAEEAAAERRRSSIEAGRRKAGLLGAAAAGAMLGLRDIYEGPPKDDDIVIVSEAPGEPGDIDKDGISARVDDIDYWAPPPDA